MTERIRLAGGDLVLTSDVGSGTTIEFRIPLDVRAEGWHTPAPR
jgi:signal transduction histidine kinase